MCQNCQQNHLLIISISVSGLTTDIFVLSVQIVDNVIMFARSPYTASAERPKIYRVSHLRQSAGYNYCFRFECLANCISGFL